MSFKKKWLETLLMVALSFLKPLAFVANDQKPLHFTIILEIPKMPQC